MAPTQQKPAQQQNTAVAPAESRALSIPPTRIPFHEGVGKRYGITGESWRSLVDALYTNAQDIGDIMLMLSYCKSRNLDPMKKPVHLVPIWNKDKQRMVCTVWPGIGELRTTAFRTKCYCGADETEFGPKMTEMFGNIEVEVYEWARMTVYRIVNGTPCKFVGPKVYWRETYSRSSGKSEDPNSMWVKRPNGQLEKCAEAAALRKAFPEEINEYIPEEIERSASATSVIDVQSETVERMLIEDNRADQEERDAVLQATANMTAHDEPEPERELVPAKQKQESQQQRSQPVTSGSVPPQQIDQLEVWLVERYRDHAALMADHDTILEAYDSMQMASVAKLIKQRLAALAKKAD